MKRFTTMFLALCFVIGGFIAVNNKSSGLQPVATMNAAEVSNSILPTLRIPTDLRLSPGTKAVPDTIVVHDTVYTTRTMHLPTNHKCGSRIIRVPYAVKSAPDTLYLPILYVLKEPSVREEQTVNENHSTDKQLQDSCFMPVWQRVSTLERSH